MYKNIVILLLILLLIAGFTIQKLPQVLFSNLDYKNKILVDCLLLNNTDVAQLFLDNGANNLKYSKEFKDSVNLTVQLKNIDNKSARGSLVVNVHGYREILVNIDYLTPNMKNYIYYVIPLPGAYRPSLENSEVDIYWSELYTKG